MNNFNNKVPDNLEEIFKDKTPNKISQLLKKEVFRRAFSCLNDGEILMRIKDKEVPDNLKIGFYTKGKFEDITERDLPEASENELHLINIDLRKIP